MKNATVLSTLALAALLATACSKSGHTPPAPASPDASAATPIPAPAAGHPLRGVIVDVRPGDSALLVKHEDIPGVMPAMTMLFKVDDATLRAATKGQAITATLVEKPDGFWLQDVKPVR